MEKTLTFLEAIIPEGLINLVWCASTLIAPPVGGRER